MTVEQKCTIMRLKSYYNLLFFNLKKEYKNKKRG